MTTRPFKYCRINYEADHINVDFILENLRYKDITKGASTLGTKDSEKLDGTKLDSSDATLFRALAARCLFLSLDRSDIA